MPAPRRLAIPAGLLTLLAGCGSYEEGIRCAASFEAERDAASARRNAGEVREMEWLRQVALRHASDRRGGRSESQMLVDLRAARDVERSKPHRPPPMTMQDRTFNSCWNRYQ
jgi:hypothetical protein